MRLGQLARKLDKKPQELITFLADKHQIEINSHPNSKIDEVALDVILKAFKKEDSPVEPIEIKEEIKIIEISNQNDDLKVEEATLDLIAEEVFEEENKVEDKAEVEVEVEVEKPEPVIIDKEEIIELEESNEITEEVLNQRIQDGIVKAPKQELEGPKVVGKIELPKQKRSIQFIISNSGNSIDVTEQIYETRKIEKEALKKKEAESRIEKRNKKSSRPKKARKILTEAEKNTHEGKIDSKRQEEIEVKRKEKKKQHYIQNIQQQNTSQIKQKKKKEIEKSLKRQKPKDSRPEPTSTWGKFLRWLNT